MTEPSRLPPGSRERGGADVAADVAPPSASVDVLAAQVRESLIAHAVQLPLKRREHAPALEALDALVARVTEAESHADEWLTPFDGSGREWHEAKTSPYTYQASDFSKLVAAVHEYEAALADARNALEVITKALGRIADPKQVTTEAWIREAELWAREVLARLDGSSE